jgi:hypothetical protein
MPGIVIAFDFLQSWYSMHLRVLYLYHCTLLLSDDIPYWHMIKKKKDGKIYTTIESYIYSWIYTNFLSPFTFIFSFFLEIYWFTRNSINLIFTTSRVTKVMKSKTKDTLWCEFMFIFSIIRDYCSDSSRPSWTEKTTQMHAFYLLSKWL